MIVFEDVSVAADGHQIIASTTGDQIMARNVACGAGSTQWIGQISEGVLQQLVKDTSHIASGGATDPQAEAGT